MSKRRIITLIISFGAFALTALGATEKSATEPSTENFTGDRRPGILEPPSDIPTGENARLYDFLLSSFDGDDAADAIRTSNSSAVAAPVEESNLGSPALPADSDN